MAKTSQPDNRMLWIRNADHLAQQAAEIEVLECEFASEADIGGLLNFSDQAILAARSTSVRDDEGLHKYDLSMKVANVRDLGPTSREGYVFRDGLAGEITAIVSLVFQVRTYITSTRWGHLGPTRISLKEEFPLVRNRAFTRDPVIFREDDRRFQEAQPLLIALTRLPGGLHHRVILAISHYARALREIGLDEEMAFVRLVSAIETLARDFPVGDDIFEGMTFEEIVRTEELSSAQAADLRTTFEVRKARRRFIDFVMTYSKGFLRGGRTNAPHTRIDRAKLPGVLDAIYRARSAYLHQGIPMFLSSGIGRYPVWHTDPIVGQIIQNREFREQDKLPYLHFFHRLVRHSIMRYVNTSVG